MDITIRANSGLGDALYLQSVARHFVLKGHSVEVCSDWPDVFRYLPVKVSPFRRHPVTHCAAYTMRKRITKTTQFEDCCFQAGIRDAELKLDWQPTNLKLIDQVRRKPSIIVLLPRRPMNRTDGFGDELLPDCAVVQSAIDMLKDHRFRIIQVGSGDALFHFSGIDLDLSNRTTVSDLIDVAWACNGVLGYCSFLVPLAESLGKPALFVWSRRGLESRTDFIAQITPKKILHNASSSSVIDDCSIEELRSAIDELYHKGRCKTTVDEQIDSDCRQWAGVPG